MEDLQRASSQNDPTTTLVSESDFNEIYTFYESEDDSPDEEPRSTQELIIEIPDALLVNPKACFEPFEPPQPAASEQEALDLLLPKRCKEDDFLELNLNDFVVYCDTTIYPNEMRSLNQLDAAPHSQCLYFDGTLSDGKESRYVRRVRIAALPIGNYGQESQSQTSDNIWIQSELNLDTDIYYKLQAPAAEYQRFHEPFLWVADLAKHFVDFLTAMYETNTRVSIQHFRRDFAVWLLAVYAPSDNYTEVSLWMLKYPGPDYRSAVNSNVTFLYKESVGAIGNKATQFHHIWDEILYFSKYKPEISNASDKSTVVTSYIYDCFHHLPFGSQLKVVKFGPNSENLRSQLLKQRESASPVFTNQNKATSEIRPGDTISTTHDTAESGSAWKREVTKHEDEDRWFALVQSISSGEDGQRIFEVIWYYRPLDTLCGLMKYPWANELFLSDHCSCMESSKIHEDEILGVHRVDFGGNPGTTMEYFCRQTYMTEEKFWVSVTQSHLNCPHTSEPCFSDCSIMHEPGDTVLVHLDKSSSICEPCEIVNINTYPGNALYSLRRLRRRREVDPSSPNSRLNELVYTKELTKAWMPRIVGRCHIRWFHSNDRIPTPYNRDGVGAFFFFTHQKELTAGGATFTPLAQAPSSLKQGPNIHDNSIPKMRGLDLFCGGGNFGRGLEEGGAVRMQWANDVDTTGLHTYMANASKPEQVSPFLGSIDEFQRRAIQGHFGHNVPKIGDVDFISGGSPCPGFSVLTNDRTTLQQRKNQSLVAAFASCVDVYRPKYGVLENVVGIIQKQTNRDQDVFSQLTCALVGMGYQARLFFLDALSCGSAQVRSRVFIVFAAPGWALPEAPLQTHSHPPTTRNVSIGKLPTGDAMAKRVMAKVTPFKYKTASQATAGLPKIYDGKPDICISFPDHRVVGHTNTQTMRKRVRLIPKFPLGMNFSQAWYGYSTEKIRAAGRGVLTSAERETFPPCKDRQQGGISPTGIKSNAYGRQHPHQPMPTVVTNASPGDAKQGRMIHWDETRCLTIMEAKRAQGFRDEEILLGPKQTQFKIVGNSVAREVSIALGAVIADAVLRSYAANSQSAVIEREGSDGATPRACDFQPHLSKDEITGSTSVSKDVPRSKRQILEERCTVEEREERQKRNRRNV